MNEINIVARMIIFLSVGILIGLDAGTVQRIYIQNNVTALKGLDIQLVCDILQFGSQIVSVYKTDSSLSDTSGIIAITACIPSRCTKQSLGRYTFSSDSSHVYIGITSLTRLEDQKWWTCAIEIQRKQLHLTIYTVPETLQFENPPTQDQDLAQNAVTLQCKTGCTYPQPSFTWFLESEGLRQEWSSSFLQNKAQAAGCTDSERIYTSSLSLARYTTFTENTKKIGKFVCGITSFPGLTQPLYTPSSMNVHFAAPPSAPVRIQGYTNNDTLKFIEDTQGVLNCSIEGGNPLATLTWNCYNSGKNAATTGMTVIKTVIWITLRNTDRNCTCMSSHPVAKAQSVSVRVEILYPPTKPLFKMKSTPISGSVNVIRGDPISVSCSSVGNPVPSYKWTLPSSATSNDPDLSVNSIQNNGRYTCIAQNFMQPTNGAVVTGSNSSYIDVNLLYSPKIGDLRNLSVVEGDPLRVICPVTVGNPPETTYQWSRTANDKVWFSQTFTVNNISRNDSMFYTCEVYNIMKPTGKQAVSLSDTGTFYLNVLYSASVTEFFVAGHKGTTTVIMNELDTVLFECNVDSNPGSTVSVIYQERTKLSEGATKAVRYEIQSVQCTDRGTYSCLGHNQYNRYKSSKVLHLLVNCAPRPSVLIPLRENVTGALHTPVVLTFTTLAYPEPKDNDFRWFRWNTGVWLALSDSSNLRIETAVLQSNLTIMDLNRTHFGTYKLEVRNTLGSYEQIFLLTPQDKPQQPWGFCHLENLVTRSSITVKWIPGSDNGVEQTFVLRYKRVTDIKWKSIYIHDTGAAKMNYTISSLSSGTEYDVVLYASNKLGNSSVTETLTVKTIDAKETTISANTIGGAVGGSIGLVIIISAFATGYFLFRQRRKKKQVKEETQSAVLSSEYVDLQPATECANTAHEYAELHSNKVKEKTQSAVLSSEYMDLQPATGYANTAQEYAELHSKRSTDTKLESDEKECMHNKTENKSETRHIYINLASSLQKKEDLNVYDNLKI